MSAELLTDVLGAPFFVRLAPDEEHEEWTFKGRDYWVQAIIQNKSFVVMFSVTSCSTRFRPVFHSSAGNLRLMETTFAAFDVNRGNPAFAVYFQTAGTNNSMLLDVYGPTNPTEYQTILVGLNDACGYDPRPALQAAEIVGQPLLDYFGPVAGSDTSIKHFRRESAVNTFAESAPHVQVTLASGEFPRSPGGFLVVPDRLLVGTAD